MLSMKEDWAGARLGKRGKPGAFLIHAEAFLSEHERALHAGAPQSDEI